MTGRLVRPHRGRLRLLFAVLASLAAATGVRGQSAGPLGAIRGSVFDKDVEAPLARARVVLVEAVLAAATGADGQFLFERVPPGTYTLAISKDGYERRVVTGVTVVPGQVAEVRADLVSEVVDMDELVVRGEDLLGGTEVGLLEVRAEARVVQDAISSELIGQAGASDAAGALRLVVGATVADGKYATVRGLSDRYTGTTLNGVRLPSADPRKRAVNIDIFPTGTIESMTVTKTFTPDLQGDFTGGGVDIKTKSIPDSLILEMSSGAEYNTVATGNDAFLTYRGGGLDASGFDRGERNLPDAAKGFTTPFPRMSTRPRPEDIAGSQDYDRLTRAFAPVMGTTTETPGANGNFAFLYGDRAIFDQHAQLGWLAALTYTNRYFFYENGANNAAYVSVKGQPMTVAHARTEAQGIQELLIGFLGSVTYAPDDANELTMRLVGNQAAEDEARFQLQDNGYPSFEQNQSLHYTERSLASAQLLGRHRFDASIGGPFKGPRFDWLAAYNLTGQSEPDVRFFRNFFDAESFVSSTPSNSTEAQNTRRIFRDIDERNGQGAANLELPFTSWSGPDGLVKTGLYHEASSRDYVQRSFTYRFPLQVGRPTDPDVIANKALASYDAASPDALWTDVFLSGDRIGLAWNTPPAPNQLLWTILPLNNDVDYTGDQTIDAAYAMTELPVAARVKIVAGARWERTDIEVVPTNEAFGRVEVITIDENGNRGIAQVPQEQAIANVREAALLPSVAAIWDITPTMKLRGSWAKTIARPTFRELAPVATEEFIFGDEFVGNPDLILSTIENWDARWEWFRRPGDVLAASVFHKALTDPIEYISFGAANRSFVQPVNYERGRLSGIELEARTALDVLHSSLAHLTAGGNVTWLRSAVDIPAAENAGLAQFGLDQASRPLQGQPEAVVNLNLTYDDDDLGITSGVFYTATGRTLLSGAALGLDGATPDVFQEPVQTLDATFTKTFPFTARGSFSLTVKAKNLLAPDALSIYRTPYGDEEEKVRHTTPRLFGLTLSWSY